MKQSLKIAIFYKATNLSLAQLYRTLSVSVFVFVCKISVYIIYQLKI